MKEGPRRSDEWGVIFDMDGVLLPSTPFHSQAFAEVFRSLGIPGFSYLPFAGWKTPDVFRAVFAQAGLPISEEQVARYSQTKSARARELLAAQAPLFQDCAPFVRQLAASYPLALASSGSRGSVQMFVEKSGLQNVFCAVVTGDDVLRAKPHPEIFLQAIARLELPPARCVVVEDAVAGVQAACAAGAIACGFGPDPEGRLKDAGARCMAESLAQLPALLAAVLQA